MVAGSRASERISIGVSPAVTQIGPRCTSPDLSFVGLILQPIGFAPDHAIKTIRCHAAKGFSPKLLVTDNWVPIDRGSCNYAWPAVMTCGNPAIGTAHARLFPLCSPSGTATAARLLRFCAGEPQHDPTREPQRPRSVGG